MKMYRNIEAFYAARGGALSRECDYGVWWTAGAGHPFWRVSYVKDSGDVYAECSSPLVGDRVLLIGTVPPVETLDTDVLAAWEKPLDELLDGWEHVCGNAFSLRWVQERLVGHPAKPVDLGNALAATLVSDEPALD